MVAPDVDQTPPNHALVARHRRIARPLWRINQPMKAATTIATLPIEDQRPSPAKSSVPVLTVDIGGSSIKVLASGHTEPRKRRSGKNLTPAKMVEIVQDLAEGWDYEAVSIGYPGLVGNQGPSSEPVNLGPGWVGFDFSSAFGLPVRIMNDAAMQALGSYEGGRMLFLGLGTGVGSTLITEEVILTLELGQLPYKRGETLGEALGRQGLKRLGKTAWRRAVTDMASALMKAFLADSVVIGGGNAKKLKELPPGVRQSHNLTAFRGGFRLWETGAAPHA
jgi:polyphosphate glucokinase